MRDDFDAYKDTESLIRMLNWMAIAMIALACLSFYFLC